MKEIKYAVQAVILNEEGRVLAVSRKDDHTDFGLVGGKVDDDDYKKAIACNPFEYAIIREVYEETGIQIDITTATEIFSTHWGGYMGITYLITDWWGEINTDEPHAVEWLPFWRITKGTFGWWNSLVKQSLDSMGVEYYDEDPYLLMIEEVEKYIESTTTKNSPTGKPYNFDRISNSWAGLGFDVHIFNEGGNPPNETWWEHDEEYVAGLEAIGKKYGHDLRFPSWYYSK